MARRLAGDVIADVILEQFGRQPGDGVPDRSYQHQHVGIVIVVAGSGPKTGQGKRLAGRRRGAPAGSRRTQGLETAYARLDEHPQSIETLAQKCQHHDLVGSELGVLALELLRDLGFNHLHEVT